MWNNVCLCAGAVPLCNENTENYAQQHLQRKKNACALMSPNGVRY